MSTPRGSIAPAEGRIDGGQLRAVLGLLLGQGLRGGVDPTTGARGNPLRQLVVSMTVIGAMFVPNAWRCADVQSYLVLLFAAVLSVVLLAIVPESQDVRARHVEILGSKPIARRTLFAARGMMLAVLATLIAATFGFFPMVAVRLHFGLGIGRLAAGYVCLVAGAFVAAIAGWVFVVLALRVWPPERVRRISQTALVVLVLGMMLSSLLASPAFALAGPGGAAPFTAGKAIELLPSTWFVRAAIGGGPHPVVSSAGASLLFVLAVIVGVGGGLDRFLPSLAETLPVNEAKATAPLAGRGLKAIARMPIVGRWLPARPAAIAETIVLSTHREEISRTRDLVGYLMAAVFFALALYGVPAAVVSSVFLYLVIGGAIEGVRLTRQTTSPEASWIFHATPVRAAELFRAIEAAAFVRSVALPLTLLTAISFRLHPPLPALLIAIGYCAVARIALAGTIAVDPGVPLSREAIVSSFSATAATFVMSLVLVVGFQVVALLATALGRLGLVLLLVADVFALALAWMAGLAAVWRLERAEAT